MEIKKMTAVLTRLLQQLVTALVTLVLELILCSNLVALVSVELSTVM
jgi:hypothetical protein